MLFALYICVNEKAPPTPPTHSVHCSLNTPPPPPPQKLHPFLFSFLPSPLLNLQILQAPFLGD